MFLIHKKFWKIATAITLIFFLLLFFIKIFIFQEATYEKRQKVKEVKEVKNSIQNKQSNLVKKENREKQSAFFTYKIKKINNDMYLLSIFLEGNNNTLVDGADLSLLYNQNIVKIKEVIPGKSFSLYPRQQILDDKIIISGLSEIKENRVIYASINSIFAEIKFKLVNEPFYKKIFTTGEEIGIYFSGKNIIDIDKSFNKIIL